MREPTFWSRPPDEQRLTLGTAQTLSGRSAHLLEKDIWVVQTLQALFTAPFAHALVFKGGTSLTKAWNAIRRFSEDVDVTHDIRAIAPDLVGDAEPDALPPTPSQEQRWTKAIRARLATWVTECAAPAIETGLAIAGTPVSVQCDDYRLTIEYTPLFRERSLVRPDVLVEFGARSTGEPHAARRVVCDIAPFVPDIAFPEAYPTAMLAERTFWEKATAAHVYCRRERTRGRRGHLARHWHDLVRLDRTGFAERALADHQLAMDVANHKAIFFREKDQAGHWVDYRAAVSGGLQLVPTGTAREQLAEDHRLMVESGVLLDDWEPFEELMDACADLERRANGR